MTDPASFGALISGIAAGGGTATATTAGVGSAAAAAGSAAAGTGIATSTYVAGAGLVAGVGGQVAQQAASREAAEMQRAIQQKQTQRSQVQALREAQIKRAILTQAATNSGTADSSGFAGGMASLTSQLASNQAFSSQVGALSQRQARYTSRANTAASVGELGGTVFGLGLNNPDFFNG